MWLLQTGSVSHSHGSFRFRGRKGSPPIAEHGVNLISENPCFLPCPISFIVQTWSCCCLSLSFLYCSGFMLCPSFHVVLETLLRSERMLPCYCLSLPWNRLGALPCFSLFSLQCCRVARQRNGSLGKKAELSEMPTSGWFLPYFG